MRGAIIVAGKGLLGCLLWLGVAGPAWPECLTSLPMQLLEECILSESEGRPYPAQVRLGEWRTENGHTDMRFHPVPGDHIVAGKLRSVGEPPRSPGAVSARDGTY